MAVKVDSANASAAAFALALVPTCLNWARTERPT